MAFPLEQHYFPEKEKSYRYVRYKGPKGSYCNIAEMAFFEDTSDTLALKGRIIGLRLVSRKTARMIITKYMIAIPILIWIIRLLMRGGSD